jgi:hypothetical protein
MSEDANDQVYLLGSMATQKEEQSELDKDEADGGGLET